MEEYLEANRGARFRGIFSDSPRQESVYGGFAAHTKSNTNVPLVKSGLQFIATTDRGADGSFSIIPLNRPGIVPINEPVVTGHTGAITDVAFSPFEDLVMASASKDMKINFWKIPRKGLTSDLYDPLLTLEGHEAAVNFIRFHPTTNHLLASASSDHTVKLWDFEKKVSIFHSVHENITGLVFDYTGLDYLVSSRSENVKVCDSRNRVGIVNTLQNSVGNLVLFLGQSHIILTMDTAASKVKFWDARNLFQEVASIDLPTPPSADITPEYDPDTKLLYVADKTNKYISVYDQRQGDPYLKQIYTYKSKTAAKAIALVPKRSTNIAGCEVARLLKLVSGYIEPLSFSVPRILDHFQEDIYPDSFAGKPSQTKEEWLSNDVNKPPVLESLQKEYAETEKFNASMLTKVPEKIYSEGESDDEDSSSDEENEIPFRLLQGTPFLKFGKRGVAHEKMLRLQEGRYLSWDASWFSPKFGRRCFVDLEKALRIQKGQMTTKFDRESKFYGAAKDTAFSIIYIEKREEKSIDFIAQSKEDFDQWYDVLDRVLKKIRNIREATALTTRFLRFTFELADSDKNEVLSSTEVTTLISELSINSTPKDVQYVFQQVAGSERSDNITMDQFSKFVFTLRRRFDLELLWNRLVDDKMVDEVLPLQVTKNSPIDTPFEHEHDCISLEKFYKFLKTSTQMAMNDADAEKKVSAEADHILRVFMGDKYDEQDPKLSYDGFFRLMNSETNDAYDPFKKSLHEDMGQPLSNYFMYSSHNTYLETDQLIGNSSVNRYINDLLRGVRCVELDTWDGPEGDPIIKHGNTLTSSIAFLDVIKAIKTFAFATSSYPVLLSIENHCSLQQQRRMAIMMRGIFGEMLLDANEGYYSRSDTLLESPEELREKILVKGSRPRMGAQEEEEQEEDDEYDENDDDDESENVISPGSVTMRRAQDLGSTTGTDDDFSAENTSFADDESLETGSVMSSVKSASVRSGVSSAKSSKRGKLHKQSSNYSTTSKLSSGTSATKSSKTGSKTSEASDAFSINTALGLAKEKTHEFLASVTYIATCKLKHFDPEVSKTIPADHISSFGETTMEKHSKKHLKDWIEHNKSHLSRIYPKGSRVDSSNYDPIPAWCTGAQVVALNTQTHDLPNILNDGLFRQNGGSGYVLKPDYMLYKDAKKDPPCRVRINIISGQSFPKMKGSSGFPNPSIEVSINGLGDDTVKFQSSTVYNNGFDPLWDEVFDFSIKTPDLAQLTFQVMNEDSIFGINRQNLIASGSIPLCCLRSGYRIVRLYDENGRNDFEFAFATLFIHISREVISKDL